MIIVGLVVLQIIFINKNTHTGWMWVNWIIRAPAPEPVGKLIITFGRYFRKTLTNLEHWPRDRWLKKYGRKKASKQEPQH